MVERILDIQEGKSPREEEPQPLKVAFIFPGQGSQEPGMGADLYNYSAAAREVFDQADKILGFSLSDLCFYGPPEELRRTINSQPAIFTVSCAALAAAKEFNSQFMKENTPCVVAGHSLGEYTALFYAGALDFPDTLKLVRERGRLMDEAGRINPGGMAAIIGLDESVVEEICREAGVWIANINAPKVIVISGEKASLPSALDWAKIRGAKTVSLKVSGAFHSPLMKTAQEAFEPVLASIKFADPKIPIVHNVTAELSTSGRESKIAVRRQLVGSVLWSKSMKAMEKLGAVLFCEFGPGNVLTGLAKRNIPRAVGFAVDSIAALDSFKQLCLNYRK